MYFFAYFKLLEYIKECVEKNIEFTLRIDTLGKIHQPKNGFVVSITPLIKIQMDNLKMIEYVIEENIIEINEKEHNLYIGGWNEDNKENLKMDISIVIEDKSEAIEVGKYCEQEAIYDISNKKTIKI